MRGSARSGRTTEALKSVEVLFETQTVAEIREVETKTKADIEDKQKQLRLLVGNSYRDLISSADTILEMAKTCGAVLRNIQELQGGFAGLAGTAVNSEESRIRGQEASKRKQLHALGSRIKYLVDTPEVIWGGLDSHAYLDAATRFLRAAHVYGQLQKFAPSELRSKFPLVYRQWPNIQKFRNQIAEHVNNRLDQQELRSATESATALAAVASLEELTSEQVLEMLLRSRQRAIARLLEHGHSDSQVEAHANTESVLKEVLHLIQETVWQAGRLFTAHHDSEHEAMLPQLLADSSLSGELLFGPLQPSDESSTSSEAEAWKVQNAAICDRVTPLSQPQVAKAVEGFMRDVAATMTTLGKQCVSKSCRAVADVVSLESSLRAAIGKWKHVEDISDSQEDSMLSPRHASVLSPRHSHPPSTPKRAVASLEPITLPSTWDQACEWVLAKRISLWDVVLEPTFIQVGKDLITASLSALEDSIQSPLQECLQDALASPAAPPGSYRAPRWPEEVPASKVPGRKRARYDDSARALSSSKQAAAVEKPSWRERLPDVKAAFDAGLQSVLRDTMLLVANQAASKEGHLRRAFSGRSSFPLPPSQSRGRAQAFEPFLQHSCASCASRVADQLQELLAALPEAAFGPEGVSAVEQALVIGRLSLGFSSSATVLPTILGPPEHWKDWQPITACPPLMRFPDGRLKSRQSSHRSEFLALQQRFRQVSLQAQRKWAAWAARALGQELEKGMLEDAALVSDAPLRVWEETSVTQESETGESQEDTKFHLPAIPSPGVMMFLLAAGRELQRAGGAASGSAALEILQLELASAAIQAFSDALSEGQPLEQKISEKGTLQLLFDARFLKDVLLEGELHQHPPGLEAKELVSQQQSAFQEVEMNLQERLDPIDWAIYGMYLWQNEAAFFRRVRILFGSLLEANRLYAEDAKASPSGEANILTVAPTAPRFAYLPISTPSTTAANLRRLPSAVIAQAGGVDEYSQNNDYSFASVGGRKTRSDLKGDAETSSSNAFEALQSRFTSQRLGALGSLLGDRAAEVTAMAQQSFSDISLPSAFTSALGGGSSTSGGASALLASFRGF